MRESALSLISLLAISEFYDIIMECKRPFLIQSAIKGPLDAEEQHLSDLEFTNISGSATRGSLIQGNPGYPVKRINFNNINFVYSGGEDIAEAEYYTEFKNPCAPEAFHIENAENVFFDKLRIDWNNAGEKFKHTIYAVKSNNIEYRDLQSDRPNCIK